MAYAEISSGNCFSLNRHRKKLKLMRISCQPGDDGYPAYQALPNGVTPIIRLDGKIIKNCVTACSKTGFVLRLETDSKGKPVINAKGDAVKYEHLHGKVEIQIRAAS